MKYAVVFFLLITSRLFAQDFKLQNGDLIFQEGCSSQFDTAIKQVTTSMNEYNFTHIGIVYIGEENRIFVLEATPPKVVLTPLEEYLYPQKTSECYPKSVVGRLKKNDQNLINKALEEGLLLLGKEYDYGFELNNDKFYCSELIYEIFRLANQGQSVFSLNKMTFKSNASGETTKGWLDYFEIHKLPIPEGEMGINPGAMSYSDAIQFVHVYN